MERARRLDLAAVSTGDLSPESIFTRYGLLAHDEIISLERAGAIEDVLCRFIDADGRVIDHPVNDRVLAVHPADLSEARDAVLASGEWSKPTAIRASIKLLSPSVLITDPIVAERLAVTWPPSIKRPIPRRRGPRDAGFPAIIGRPRSPPRERATTASPRGRPSRSSC